MTNTDLLKEIKSQFSGTEELPIPQGQVRGPELQISVTSADLHPVCQYLKNHSPLSFDFPNFVTAVDWIEEGRFELVYNLFSTTHKHTVILKVSLGRDNPEVASVTDLWPGMDWQEREIYDLFGIRFKNHPNPKRILMWEGFPGWPLRKDYVHTRDKYDSGVEIGLPIPQHGQH